MLEDAGELLREARVTQDERKMEDAEALVRASRASLLWSERWGLVDYPLINIQLGEIENALGDPVEAERRMNRALELDPDLENALWWVYTFRSRERDVEAAERTLLKLLEVNPGHEKARAALESLRAFKEREQGL